MWKAGPLKGVPDKMSSPRRITVHHSGGKAFGDSSAEATGKMIRSIQQNHQQERGWCDIGYHFIIDRGGRVWEGRPASQLGAHAGSISMNQANLGIVVLGNFDLQAPARAQLSSLERLLVVLCRRHGIRRTEVYGHGEVRRKEGAGATECPGRLLSAWVEDFRRGRKWTASGSRSVLSAAAVKP
jgi:N-acetyl-anhydromuramyl-L-alanine amidase AmpD